MRSADDRFEYRDQQDRPLPAGSCLADAHRFAFWCRQRQTTLCSLNLRGRGHDVEKKSWILSGTVDAPTLLPSVNCKECWHGFLRDGVFYRVDQVTRETLQ